MGKLIAIYFKILEKHVAIPAAQTSRVISELTELSLLNFMEEYVIKTLGGNKKKDKIFLIIRFS